MSCQIRTLLTTLREIFSMVHMDDESDSEGPDDDDDSLAARLTRQVEAMGAQED